MNPSSRSQLAPAVDLRDAVVLLVDDDIEGARHIGEQLKEAGFQLHLAHTGPQAKQVVFRNTPDAVLIDLKRADMDSFELCRQLKMTPQTRSIPVLFISDRSDVSGKVRAFRLGAVDYLLRPFEFEELLVRVEIHIRNSRKLKDLEREKAELTKENKDLKKEKPSNQPIYANPADLPNGFVLDGKYRLDGRIGLGGFGVVYRATHLQLQRQVAVKVFRSLGNLSTEEALRRFRQEGTSASRLNHPNAVAMLDSGIAPGGIPYLAMELLVGRTLSDELRDRHILPLSRCIQIILPVCDVLVEAHAVAIVHRDIKPENVFLHRARFGEVIKVLDFGIAKMLGADTADIERPAVTGGGGILGTPTYMAPERLRHGPYDGRSDVYSIGVMLYQMLCGKTPFPAEAKGFLELVLNHLNEPAPPLRKWNPAIPEPIANLVMRTLLKDPAARPTARELLTELVQVVRKTTGTIEGSDTMGSPRAEETLFLLRDDLHAPQKSFFAVPAMASSSLSSAASPPSSSRSSTPGLAVSISPSDASPLPSPSKQSPSCSPSSDTLPSKAGTAPSNESGVHLPTAATQEVKLSPPSSQSSTQDHQLP
jgi:serine/threonine protein kinase/ActR/RegA family two-component response regulator